jgi:ABC-2 type transport system ATP-binding protein
MSSAALESCELTPAVEALGLSRRFGSLAAVESVDFRVEQGEFFAFLGPNGAGKTTTIQMLCTLKRPSAGRATVNGFDVVEEGALVRSSIGIVFQEPTLDDYLTAEQNLRYHCMIYHVPKRERESRIDEVLSLVELGDRRRDSVRTFSGGMKRRLEVARALLHEPAVLFLDEPTTGLDPQTRRYLWEHLQRLRDEVSLTLFLTTHYLAEAEEADGVAVIDHGRIIAQGSPAELTGASGAETLEDAFVLLTGGDLRPEEASRRERLASARRGRPRL